MIREVSHVWFGLNLMNKILFKSSPTDKSELLKYV